MRCGSEATYRYVNRSAVTTAEVPVAVATRTSRAPAVPAGVVAEQLVAELQETAVALTPLTVIELTCTNFVPVTVIRVPPRWLPEAGLTAVTAGAGATPVPVTGIEMAPKMLFRVM